MKRLALLVAVGAGCLLFQSAQATLLFSDGFNYPTPGNLGGNVNPGSGFGWGPGNNNITVGNGNLTYAGLQDLGGNEASIAWGVSAGSVTNGFAPVTSGSIYYSFLIDCTALPTGNSYLTSLNPGTSAPNGGSDALSVYAGTVTGGGAWKIGIRTPALAASFASTTLSLGQTYFIIVGYNFATANATLYLSGVPGGVQPLADVSLTGNGSITSIDDVGFKAQGAAITGTFLVDNILVGTTWGDVTPVGVPEPATFGIAGLGMLGLVLMRRMRR